MLLASRYRCSILVQETLNHLVAFIMARRSVSFGFAVTGIVSILLSPLTAASPISTSLPKQRDFDYVVVGSGPGGSVVASRLAELPGISVAIIEAGTWAEDMVGNLTFVPGYDGAFLLKSVNQAPSAVDWGFVTTPQSVGSISPRRGCYANLKRA